MRQKGSRVQRRHRRNACQVLALVGVLVLPLCGAAGAEAASGGEEDPLAILENSMRYLGQMEQFRFVAHISFDVLQEDGQKIEFGSKREVAVHRPDRLRVDIERRDGSHAGIVFDGKVITLFNATQKVYATEDRPGDIDQTVAYIADELDVPTPLGDLLVADPYAILGSGVESAWNGGVSIVAGVECDHLAFRTNEVDYQLWVARGESPLPWRLKIIYKQEEGKPEFAAQFVEWTKEGAFAPTVFAYKPPEGSEKILFTAQVKRPASLIEEAGKAKGGQE